MIRPATGIETSTPSATWGSTPIVTNSVVPIAKPPIGEGQHREPEVPGPGRAGSLEIGRHRDHRRRRPRPVPIPRSRSGSALRSRSGARPRAEQQCRTSGTDASTILGSDCTRKTSPEVGAQALPAYADEVADEAAAELEALAAARHDVAVGVVDLELVGRARRAARSPRSRPARPGRPGCRRPPRAAGSRRRRGPAGRSPARRSASSPGFQSEVRMGSRVPSTSCSLS